MSKEKILIAADHGGAKLKEALKEAFADRCEWIDLGTHEADSVDYPDYADKLAKAMAEDVAARGVLICGSGIGISMAANRHAHIRCAVCTNVEMARLARQHNHANVLSLGERILDFDTARDILKTFLETDVDTSERHVRRVNKLSCS